MKQVNIKKPQNTFRNENLIKSSNLKIENEIYSTTNKYLKTIKFKIMKTIMTKLGLISFIQILSFTSILEASSLSSFIPVVARGVELTFTENKCFIKDYAGKMNNKILFVAQSDNAKYLFRKDGFMLQLSNLTVKMENEDGHDDLKTNTLSSFGKLEIVWEGMNKNADVYGGEEINTIAFKNLNDPATKDCEIKNYRKLYYTEVYPGIDLHYYDHDNKLKYEMIVQPGFDYKEIKMRIEGINEMFLNAKGQLIIKTDAGDVIKDAPLVLQNGKPLVAKWILSGKTLSLDIKNINPGKELSFQTSMYKSGNFDYKL